MNDNKDNEEHLSHLHVLFHTLAINHLYINIKKCTFLVKEISFLGYIINEFGISVDSTKVEAIKNWPLPKTVRDIQSFLGLASFYRKFIKNFSLFLAPLTDCLKKGEFIWTIDQTKSFSTLKEKLCCAPVLALPDFTQPFEVAVDASGYAIGAILSQKRHPVEFF